MWLHYLLKYLVLFTHSSHGFSFTVPPHSYSKTIQTAGIVVQYILNYTGTEFMFIYKYVTIITSLLLYAQEINQM